MSANGEDEMDLGSNAGSQHYEEDDFEDMLGTQLQESYQELEDTEMVFDPNAPHAEPTPEPESIIQSNGVVSADCERQISASEVPSKKRSSPSATPTKDGLFQNHQPENMKASASPVSVVQPTQVSDGPTPTQRTDANSTRPKRTPKGIPADAFVIDLDSVEIASPQAQFYASSVAIKKEDDYIEIAQKEFSPRIKQEFNDDVRWIWCASKDDPMVISDDEDEEPVQAGLKPGGGAIETSSTVKQPAREAENGSIDAEYTRSDTDGGAIEKETGTNLVGNHPKETSTESTGVDTDMIECGVDDVATNTEVIGNRPVRSNLNLGNSILGKPIMSAKAKGDLKKQMLEAQKIWAAQGLKRTAPGGASDIFHKPETNPIAGTNEITGSSRDAPVRANGALLASDEWTNLTLEDDEKTVANFAAIKKKYQAKKRVLKNTFIDDVEFMKAQTEETTRVKRLQEELEQSRQAGPGTETPSHDMNDEGDGLFLPEPHRPASSYKPPYMEDDDSAAEPELGEHDDNHDSDNQTFKKRRKPSAPKRRAQVIPKDTEEASLLAGIEADKVKDAKNSKRKPSTTPKKPSQKSKGTPKGQSAKASKKTKEPKPKKAKAANKKNSKAAPTNKGQPNLLNLGSLLGNDLYGLANANTGRAQLAAPTAKAKAQALKELIASVPEEDRRGAKTDKTHVLKATKVLSLYNVHYDGQGGWLLKGMVSSLRPYQVLGAAFMKERETGNEQPYGGLHADEMGFGKTVMMIAAMIANPPRSGDTRKATLIVATPALVSQWMHEIELHTKDNVLGAVIRYHAGSRLQGTGALMFLQTADIILTSYNEIVRSYPKYDPPKELVTHEAKEAWWRTEYEEKRGLLHRCNFYRIVLDEAQIIKNHKSQTSIACRGLMAKHRWAVSGTPIHNTVEELFPYFKFLRVKHTGTYDVFKENFCEKGSEVANERLHSFLRKFMIRRTHADSLFGAPLVQLPENHQQTINVEFNQVERAIYDIVRARYIRRIHSYHREGILKHKYNNILTMLLRLRQLTAHIFLLQEVIEDIFELEDVEKLWELTRAETNPENPNKDIVLQMKKLIVAKGKRTEGDENDSVETPVPENIDDLDEDGEPRGIIFKFRKYLRNLKQTSKWGDLKDRSLCHRCHDRPDDPYVTSCMHIFCKECLEAIAFEAAEKGEDHTACQECGTIYTAVNQCDGIRELGWEDNSNFSSQGEDGPVRRSRKDPNEDMKWINFEGHVLPSAKTAALAAQVDLWLKESPDGKIIVFTQFTLMIKIIGRICNQREWGYCTYHGKMTLPGRERAIRDFKSQKDKRILLASLKCGGVGLNLTMASRVICIDLWWNSCVEQQAFCRIFRIGQTEKTYITRFVVKNTVDEKLDLMQQEKSQIITHAMGDDGKRPGKLSLNELVRLFGPMGEGDDEIKEFIIVDDDDEFEGDVPPIAVEELADGSVRHPPRHYR